MKKIVLTLAISICALFILAFSAFATEYNVSSNEEYESTYAQATNGDTIVVSSKLTCDIYANKSITYILKADWESAKLVINQSNVEVSFIADGGNYKIMPTNYSTTDGWLNVAEAYKSVVINLGGKNGGTVTIDGSNVTHERLTYVTASGVADITWNLLDGSAVANFNPQTKDSTTGTYIIYGRTINMYKGSKIYGNRIASVPLMRATYFNLFDGEIFGNVLENTRVTNEGAGAIYVSERIMVYGGSIYKNIFNAKSTSQDNYIGFFTTQEARDVVILNLEIGDTYVSGTDSNNISAMFGTTKSAFNAAKFYYNSKMQKGTRYTFTGTPYLENDTETGKEIWKVSSYTKQSDNWTGRSWTRTDCPGDGVAVFLNASKKSIAGSNFDTYTVINAYINGVYAYSGSTTIAIPSGYDLWSTDANGYCHTGKAYTLDEVKAVNTITLYTAYEAEKVTVNGTTSCSGCGMAYTCNNPEHDLQVVSITYSSYMEKGVKIIKCNTCGLEKASEIEVPALFSSKGYSASLTDDAGIAVGFSVNNEAILEYENATGKTINYGVFAIAQSKLGESNIFDENGSAINGAIIADITGYEFSNFEVKITGFEDSQKDLTLAMGAYVKANDGVTTEYSYMQATDKGTQEGNYYFVSYNDIVG